MTALAGIVVKRIFSVFAGQSAGLRGLKTHEAGREDFADLGQAFFTLIRREIRDHHFLKMILLGRELHQKQSLIVIVRLQSNS
jgi:hypothetical protein